MQLFRLDKLTIVSSGIEEIKTLLGQKLKNAGKPFQIITLNLDFFRIATEDQAFHLICQKAEMIVPDGNGITSLLRIKYREKVNRITGTDIFKSVLELSDELPIRVALVGSTEEVLKIVNEKITSSYPRLNVVSLLSPPQNFEGNYEENKRIIQEIKKSSPTALFLALGCPRQEYWIAENMEEIGALINVGIGSVFDTYSGKKKRAPLLFQRMGLEWFFRLISEPKRLYKRYLVYDFPFFFSELLKIIRQR